MINKLYQWIEQDNLIRFYHSSKWREVRATRMKIDNFECQSCKSIGKYSKAEMVHHIIHVKDNPELALSLSNLVSLCNQCHNKAHPEKLKDNISKNKFMNEERW